jgi:hypothetical protein
LSAADSDILCPLCKEGTRVYKVSKIYLESLSGNQLVETADESLEEPGQGVIRQAQSMRNLVMRFAPPSGKAQSLRSLHPDQVVGVAFLLSLFFLWQIMTVQPSGLLPALGIWLLALALYGAGRKRLLARYAAQQAEKDAEKQAIERAIARWMELYYCGRDDVVFVAAGEVTAPADEMMDFLFS